MEASRACQAGKHDKGQETLVPRSLLGKKGTRKGRGLSDGVKIPCAITVEKNTIDVHLEEKHVTWAQLGKKLDKNTTLGFSKRGDGVKICYDTVRKYFTTFPTREELEYHEWLLKNPRPSWVRAKIRKRSLDNIKIQCMIRYFLKEQTYINLESPVNIMFRLYYYWIMSEALKAREKLSNPRKTCNFVGRVRGIKVFVGNFTYECDFMVLEDVSSVIDHYLDGMVLGKPFVKQFTLTYDKEEGTVMFEKNDERVTFKMPHKIKRFKDMEDLNTDNIPPFFVASKGDEEKEEGYVCRKRMTHYSDCLKLGPEYKRDEGIIKTIKFLNGRSSSMNDVGVT
ncbi:protein kinase-like domain, concanavalin A-like lectin/glucanase domain protein [Tanacetum coccineum]